MTIASAPCFSASSTILWVARVRAFETISTYDFSSPPASDLRPWVKSRPMLLVWMVFPWAIPIISYSFPGIRSVVVIIMDTSGEIREQG